MKDRLVTIALSVATTLGLMRVVPEPVAPQRVDPAGSRDLEIDRLIVRKELIVSDTGAPWEKGFEAHQIPRGIYARSLGVNINAWWGAALILIGGVMLSLAARARRRGAGGA